MLQVTVDVFSGRPNPSWIISDEAEVRDVLKAITLNRDAVAEVDSGYQGLGYRGVHISTLDDSMESRYGGPSQFKIANGGSQNEAKGLEIAERLISRMPVGTVSRSPAGIETELKEELRDRLLEDLASHPRFAEPSPSTASPSTRSALAELEEAKEPGAEATKAVCPWLATPFNPGFWNNDPFVKAHNNCYNYGCNRKTNTFAQPGRAHGYTASMDCGSVTTGALKDGNHKWGVCFPAGTSGLWIMALVVAPGYDYHWYRYSQEGFWGHKPGGTEAKNWDNLGNIIWNPVTCARDPYTDFCGYFQTASTVVIN